eukprot:3919992-Pyramimonas_sp.AAC.1
MARPQLSAHLRLLRHHPLLALLHPRRTPARHSTTVGHGLHVHVHALLQLMRQAATSVGTLAGYS